jgi:non-heme chloroperoxidase
MIAASLLNPMRDALRRSSDRTFKDRKRSHDPRGKKSKTTAKRTPEDWPNYIRTSERVALFYRDWGAGKPLLFLSGWTLNSDLAAWIEQLDLTGLTLVGHSFASGEIVRYLTRHGSNRVDRLVFVSPAAIPFLLKTPDNPIGIEAAAFDQLRQTFTTDFPGWAQANAEPYFTPETSGAVVDWTMQMMTQTSLLAAAELNRIQTSTDFRSELQRIDRPTLIVHGDRDASRRLSLLAGRLPRSSPERVWKFTRAVRMACTLRMQIG